MRLALLLFSRYYSVSNTLFKPTCIAVQFASPVLQYTSFLVDDCFSIRPGDSCLFPAALAIQRKEHQRRIPVDLRARVCSAGRTFNPFGMPLRFFHHGTFFGIQAVLTQCHTSSQVTMSGTEKVSSSPTVKMIGSPVCASTESSTAFCPDHGAVSPV